MNINIKELEIIDLPFGEKLQLEDLVRDYGYLGAIECLEPLTWNNPGRDQRMADRHKLILKSINLKQWCN